MSAADRRSTRRVAGAISNNAASKKTDSRPTKKSKVTETSGAPLSDLQKQVVDFSKLEMASLKKYQRYFKLDNLRPNATKEEVIRSVIKHFAVEPKLRETQVISEFLFAIRRDPREAAAAAQADAAAAAASNSNPVPISAQQ